MSVSPAVPGESSPPPSPLGERSWWQQVTPLAHARIFRVDPTADVDLDRLRALPPPYEMERGPTGVTASTVALLGREAHSPSWARSPELDAVEHDLFVMHWYRSTPLLFLTFTHRSSDSLYEAVLKNVVEPGGEGSGYRLLRFDELKKVFHGFTDLQVINVGMHTESKTATDEAYRFLAGKRLRGDPQRRTGHVVAIGEVEGRRTTLGFSRKSKVWATDHLTLDALAAWCDWLAARLDTRRPRLPAEIAALN